MSNQMLKKIIMSKHWSKKLLPISACVMLSGFAFAATAKEQLADPTRPLHQSKSLAYKQSLNLNAILFANNRRQAVINGQQMVEGQTNRNVRVLAIHKNDVVVLHDGKKRTLKLHQSMKKNVSGIVRTSSSTAEAKGLSKEKNSVASR